MPLQRCTVDGVRGYRYGTAGKCYTGPKALQRAQAQAQAIRTSGYATANVKRRSPLARTKLLAKDPSRTKTLRRQFEQDLMRHFNRLRRSIIELVLTEDAFGLIAPTHNDLTTNAPGRWRFRSTSLQVKAFEFWLKAQVAKGILKQPEKQAYWERYIEEGYKKGTGRAFDDSRAGAKAAMDTADKKKLAFYEGSKGEFLRSSFAQPTTIEKVKLLAGRTFTDLKGVTEAMSTVMSRTLVDGLVQGQHPRVIASILARDLDKIGKNRAKVIARTEIIRSHAEGQLDGMEKLGVDKIGVAVEWDTAGDGRVCPLCRPLDGVVFSVKEARGLIPRHANCRCAYMPANVGETTEGQLKQKAQIKGAMERSIKKEIPKKSKRSLAQQKQLTKWGGADKRIAKKRPVGPFKKGR